MNINFERKHVKISQEAHLIEELRGKDAGFVLESGCEVLEELGIKHWLSDGTLLALTRDGEFLPHDSDIDVDVFFETAEEASHKLPVLVSEFYDLRHGSGPKFDVVRQMTMGGHIMQVVFLERAQNIIFDIHVYYPKQWEDEEIDKMYTYSEHGALWYPLSMFESLEQVKYDDYEYPIPNAKDYCELRYGPNWNVPKTEKDDWVAEAANIILRPKPEHMAIQNPPHPQIHKSSINSFFKEYENIHHGKSGVLFATGPTLNTFKKDEMFDGAINVGLNRVYNNKQVCETLDYYFFGSEFKLDKEHAESVTKFLSDKKDLESFASVFRHGGFITEGNVDLKEADLLGAKSFESNHFIVSKDIAKNAFIGFSIAFPAFQFMLYSGIKKIYLVGCDLVNTSKHFDGDYSRLDDQYEFTDEARIWKLVWEKMATFAKEHYPEVEIVSVNPVGLKGLFNDLEL